MSTYVYLLKLVFYVRRILLNNDMGQEYNFEFDIQIYAKTHF